MWKDWSAFWKGMLFGAYVLAGFHMGESSPDFERATVWAILAIAFAVAGWMPRKGK